MFLDFLTSFIYIEIILDLRDHLDLRGRLVHRDAGRRRRNRYSHRSIQRGARDHRVLDRSTREKCSWMVIGEDQ